MDNKNIEVIDEILNGVDFLIEQAKSETTRIYDGLVVGRDLENKWKVRFNNGDHLVKQYGPGEPDINTMVKVIVPQGNQNLSWFFVPGAGDSLQQMTETTLGGAKAKPATSEMTEYVGIEQDTGLLKYNGKKILQVRVLTENPLTLDKTFEEINSVLVSKGEVYILGPLSIYILQIWTQDEVARFMSLINPADIIMLTPDVVTHDGSYWDAKIINGGIFQGKVFASWQPTEECCLRNSSASSTTQDPKNVGEIHWQVE